MDAIAQGLKAYLGAHIDGASDIEIQSLARIHGGASRETYRVAARWKAAGKNVQQGLILRRDPVGSLIDTARDVEYNAYRAFYGSAVPVPQPLFLEMDNSWLERPFFIMEEIIGCQAASPFAADSYGAHRDTVGEQFWRILGHIAAAEPDRIGLGASMERPALDACWRRELDYWDQVIESDQLGPQPVARAAIRWLRNNPPPPPVRLSVVHGDYRTGNFLFDDSGTIRAILDWEMCHLGDPLEDIAWAADPLWALRDRDISGGMIARERGLELWERASGLRIDRGALGWWQLFASLKGLAIWISSQHEFARGANHDLLLAFSGLYCATVHEQVLAEALLELFERRVSP